MSSLPLQPPRSLSPVAATAEANQAGHASVDPNELATDAVPTAAPSLVAQQTTIAGSRGGRRVVHARARPRSASIGSAASTIAGSPTVTRDFLAQEGYLFPDSSAAGGAAAASPGSPTSPQGHTMEAAKGESLSPSPQSLAATEGHSRQPEHSARHEGDGGRKREEEKEKDTEQKPVPPPQPTLQTAERQEWHLAPASLLANPELHRRIVAAGSSNPLHVWGHEAAFIKSRYFSRKRRKRERHYQSQKDQVERLLSSGKATQQTVAAAAAWTQSSSGRTSPNDAADVTRDKQHGAGGRGGQHADHRGSSSSSSAGSSSCSDRGYYPPPVPGGRLLNSETWTSQQHCRTRNMNALRAFSWDQRAFLPQRKGVLSSLFDLLASPRFWEKLDWTIRGSVLTILPTLILCLEPTTRHIFPLPTSVVYLAYWTTSPTLGAGLREMFVVLKGFSISLVFLIIVIAIHPGPAWVTLLILFFALLVTGFVAEQLKRMVAYCFVSLLMQYISSPDATGYKYVGDFYSTILIGQCFGLASFLFPYIRWSSENARRYIVITGDAVSLSVHGACCSFWVENSQLERQLHVARLRQLRSTVEASMKKAQQGLSEMGYEPHSGVYTARLKSRMAFLKNIFNVVQSMTLVVEQVAANPALVETPMCREFGQRIRVEMNAIAAAMDSMILRIVDLDNLVSVTDMAAFRAAKSRYEDAMSVVRDDVILSNPDYRTDNSDILLGFFLFSVEELMEMISNFQDSRCPPSNFLYLLTFPLRDVRSSWSAFVDLYRALTIRRSITRRLKESIKLSACIMVAAIFQVYAMDNSSTSPVAGVSIIAFVYRATGGESFQYSTMRMLGTVLGSLTGLLTVQIADGRRPVLYGCTLVLTFIGSYVQASPDFGPMGSALANSVVSIVLQYRSSANAMVRIQQNCFAILIYFIISSLIWPVRGRTRVNTGLDVSLRMAREATDRLLRNLDLPDSATAVSADVLALLGEMQKKVAQQLQNIPGAIAEPTLDSAAFPEMPWRMLVSAQRKLLVTLLMMRHAYLTFMTSTIADEAGRAGEKTVGDNAELIGTGPGAATSISVHWVVLHRISPYTRQLSQLFYEAVEVYLLTLSKATFVPTAELTRLRLGMMQCYDRIVAVYIDTIQHELNNSDSDEEGGGERKREEGNHNDREGQGMGMGSGKVGETEPRAGTVPMRAGVITNLSLQPAAGGDASDLGGSMIDRMSFAGPAGFMPPPSATFAPEDSFVLNNTSIARIPLPNQTFASTLRQPRSSTVDGGGTSSEGGSAVRRPALKRGTGHFSYKLTPEERQRLREYILGPNSTTTANASFFANAASASAAAAAAAAAREDGARVGSMAGPPPSMSPSVNAASASARAATSGGTMSASSPSRSGMGPTNAAQADPFLTNASMFNPNGTFWNRNVSMFDPAMLRNAGIVVQAPLYQQPQARGDWNASRASSSHRSSSILPTAAAQATQHGRNLDASAVVANAPVDGLRSRHGPSALLHGTPLHADTGSGRRGPGAGNLLPEISGGAAASTQTQNLPSTTVSSLLHQDLRNRSSTHNGIITAAAAAGTVKLSKTAKYAMPSVLQTSMVLPSTAHAMREAAAAAAVETTTMMPVTLLSPSSSGGAGLSPPPHVLSPQSFSASVPTGEGQARTQEGHHHNRMEESTMDPLGTSPSGELHRDPYPTTHTRSNQSFVSSTTGTGSGDVFLIGRRQRPALHTNHGWPMGSGPQRRRHHYQNDSGGGQEAQTHGHSAGTSAHEVPVTLQTRSREQVHVVEDTPLHLQCQRATLSTLDAPISVVTASSRAPSPPPSATRSQFENHAPISSSREDGTGMASSSEEEMKDKATGPLSDPVGQSESGGAAVLAGLLPTPIPAPLTPSSAPATATPETFSGGGEARRSSLRHRSAGEGELLGGNRSFVVGAPVIPASMRAYVDGLAAQQRLQVPPPPAVLGNLSFMPTMGNRTFISRAGAGNITNSTFFLSGGGGGGISAAAQLVLSPEQTVPNPAPASSSSPAETANTANGHPGEMASGEGAPRTSTLYTDLQADFISVINQLEFNNATFCGPQRSGGGGDTGTGSRTVDTDPGTGFLQLLGATVRSNGAGAGATCAAGVEEDVVDQYVLTNSDIHSLEAFLFGLRAMITQIEELERHLLEMVHGNEMAAKL